MIGLFVAFADPGTPGCEECHTEIAVQWRASRHAVAASNPVFQASWSHWPNGWCLQCHAPGEDQQRDLLGQVARAGVVHRLPESPPGNRWKNGVDCVACHVRDGVIRSGGRPSDTALDVHPVEEDATLANGEMCATCHEFAFQNHTPRWPFSYGTTLAQATFSEWRDSAAHAAGQTCVTCHMSEHGHGFPGAHTEGFVRDALIVETRRKADRLSVTITARGVGHAIPTGDPFRRIELWLCPDATCETPARVAWLRRSLERTETSWAIAQDTRIPADGSQVIDVAIPDGARFFQLVFRYGERRFERALPASEVGYPLASGPIPVEVP